MAKINELREKRAKIWEQAKAFLDSHRNETGILSAEDTAAYEKMEKDIVDLGHEIDRQQRADELERELNLPTSTPLVSKPDNANRESKTGTASEKYNKAFWNQMRNRSTQEVRNILSEGVDSEGGFLVPETFENTLVQALDEELVIASAKKTGKVVTVEEHSVIGGLGSAVAEVLCEKAPTKMLRIGVNDRFGESGPATELIHKYELDAEGIYNKVKAFCK